MSLALGELEPVVHRPPSPMERRVDEIFRDKQQRLFPASAASKPGSTTT